MQADSQKTIPIPGNWGEGMKAAYEGRFSAAL